MKVYTTRNRKRWAFGIAYQWERYMGPMVILQGGPFVVWLQWKPAWRTH